MSRLTLAKQGFQTLAPSLIDQSDERIGDAAESWLRDEVCPVVSELVDQPNFREATLWSVIHLSQDQRQPEWFLLQTIENRLVQFARDLLDIAERFADGTTEQDLDLLSFIAQRPWNEMASPMDFFHPSLSLFLKVPDPDCWHHNSFRRHDERTRLGDYVMRCMFARIAHWRSILQRIQSVISTQIPSGIAESDAYQASNRIFTHGNELNRAVKEMRERCQTESAAQLRDDCTTLVQVYTCYSMNPNLDWIPNLAGSQTAEKPRIRSTIRRPTNVEFVERQHDGTLKRIEQRTVSLCNPQVLRQIAGALETVTPLFEAPKNPVRMIEWARDTAQLVLAEYEGGIVYWQGRRVNVAWNDHGVEFDLLRVLARNAGAYVNQRMLANPTEHKIASRRSRLKKLLHEFPDLNAKIKNKKDVGYKIELEKSAIILLIDDGPDRLKVWH